MPTYQYRCQDCSTDLEAFQKFSDDPLTTCPTCGGSLRKVFNSVGIVFKGSGFYATDSRHSTSTASPSKTESTPASNASSDSSSSATTASAA